jgi:hypothetical protein
MEYTLVNVFETQGNDVGSSAIEKLKSASVNERWPPKTKALKASIGGSLSRVSGHNSSRYQRFYGAGNLDRGGVALAAAAILRSAGPYDIVHVAGARRGIRGLPSASVSAWIGVVRPPRERPIASTKARLFRRRPDGVP